MKETRDKLIDLRSGDLNDCILVQNGSSSSFPLTAPSSPLIMMSRTKSAKERKREAYRKKAETRASESRHFTPYLPFMAISLSSF